MSGMAVRRWRREKRGGFEFGRGVGRCGDVLIVEEGRGAVVARHGHISEAAAAGALRLAMRGDCRRAHGPRIVCISGRSVIVGNIFVVREARIVARRTGLRRKRGRQVTGRMRRRNERRARKERRRLFTGRRICVGRRKRSKCCSGDLFLVRYRAVSRIGMGSAVTSTGHYCFMRSTSETWVGQRRYALRDRSQESCFWKSAVRWQERLARREDFGVNRYDVVRD